MLTYTNKCDSSSHRRPARWPIRCIFLAILLVGAVCGVTARGEDFARPPEWSDEVKDVFFDDARDALSGEPPRAARETGIVRNADPSPKVPNEVWSALISRDALEGSVKLSVNRLAQSLQQPARFKAGLYNDCRRDLTLLGTLFEVIGAYPGDVRWKSVAPQVAQLCLRTAEACTEGTAQSLEQANDVLATLEELLRGQANENSQPTAEPLLPKFAPLMQVMKFVAEDELPAALSKPTQFRKSAVAIGEMSQLLAMLSQVIRNEEFGYADDAEYQRHADQLRDTTRALNEAATAEEYANAVQAAAAIQQSCANCHADYRG